METETHTFLAKTKIKTHEGNQITKSRGASMEAEGPSSSPRGDPPADADAVTTTVSSDELTRRLALSESVNLELERALEIKSRSSDEATRAVEHLRRELRGAMAANDADGSVPAAAMDAAHAEITRLRAALVDGERERAALKSLASKATGMMKKKGAEVVDGDGDDHEMEGDSARLRAAVAEERLAMAENALAEWRTYASALEERCKLAEAAAEDAADAARSLTNRARADETAKQKDTRAKALAATATARAMRDEDPSTTEEEGPVPPPVPAQSHPNPNYSHHQSIPPYASGPSRVAFQRARVANGELAAALAAARSVSRSAEEASRRGAAALARASALRARVDDRMGVGGKEPEPLDKDVKKKEEFGEEGPVELGRLPSLGEWAAAAAGKTASGEAFKPRGGDGDWDDGGAMRVDWVKAAADAAAMDDETETGTGTKEAVEGKELLNDEKPGGGDDGDGVDWVSKAAESRRAWAERRARGENDPTLQAIATEY